MGLSEQAWLASNLCLDRSLWLSSCPQACSGWDTFTLGKWTSSQEPEAQLAAILCEPRHGHGGMVAPGERGPPPRAHGSGLI